MVPVGDKFVLKTLLVIEESSPKVEALFGGVVEAEVLDVQDLVERLAGLSSLSAVHELRFPVRVGRAELEVLQSEAHREEILAERGIVRLESDVQVLNRDLEVVDTSGHNLLEHALLAFDHFFRFLVKIEHD